MNKLKATVQAVESSGEISLISLLCEEALFSALIIQDQEALLLPGTSVYMVFKETELSIGRELSGKLSLRNRFSSTVLAIEKGKLLAQITLNFRGHLLTSLITTASCEYLDLQPGDAVEGLLKTTELLLMQHD